MRSFATRIVLGCLLSAAAWGSPIQAADDADQLAGKWKLVVLAFGEDDFVVLTIAQRDGKLSADVASAQPFLNSAKVSEVEQQGAAVKLLLEAAGGRNSFAGTFAKQGKDAGRVLGVVSFRGSPFPARLERTEADKVAPIEARPLMQKLFAVRKVNDPKERVAKLEELLKEVPGPAQHQIYSALLQAAEKAELSEEQVRSYIHNWLADAEQYGVIWHAECRLSALKALQGQKPYAALTLDLAQDADRALGASTSTEQQAATVALLLAAARVANRPDIATEAAARLEKLEAILDEEYFRTVPPFQPDTFAGRKNTSNDRVVLVELFTGAQCPPCVAADVGFDALLKTYSHQDLIALQYHLHIPGPDPLTNPDSATRMSYYQGRGTPTTKFNGTTEAGGGGGMANARTKYDQYREIIDRRLEDKRAATINLRATRSGDKISITVSADAKAYLIAQANSAAEAAAVSAKRAAEKQAADKQPSQGDKVAGKDQDQEPAEPKKPQLRLRLALTEESIRYVGGNRLRFHHHVVRHMLGGPAGKELVDGGCQLELTADLADIRQGLTKYLDDFATRTSFPNPLPEIALKNLALVAFVQDDTDRNVLHAVSVELPAGK